MFSTLWIVLQFPLFFYFSCSTTWTPMGSATLQDPPPCLPHFSWLTFSTSHNTSNHYHWGTLLIENVVLIPTNQWSSLAIIASFCNFFAPNVFTHGPLSLRLSGIKPWKFLRTQILQTVITFPYDLAMLNLVKCANFNVVWVPPIR